MLTFWLDFISSSGVIEQWLPHLLNLSQNHCWKKPVLSISFFAESVHVFLREGFWDLLPSVSEQFVF